jgi:hypothetical protein
MLTRLWLDEVSDCHCEFCGEPEILKLLWGYCSIGFGAVAGSEFCSDTLLVTGAIVKIGMLEL